MRKSAKKAVLSLLSLAQILICHVCGDSPVRACCDDLSESCCPHVSGCENPAEIRSHSVVSDDESIRVTGDKRAYGITVRHDTGEDEHTLTGNLASIIERY